jgi:hypothetical protein
LDLSLNPSQGTEWLGAIAPYFYIRNDNTCCWGEGHVPYDPRCVCVCVCVCVRTRAVCWRELDKLEVLRSLCISWFTLGVVDKSSVQMRTWGFTLAT